MLLVRVEFDQKKKAGKLSDKDVPNIFQAARWGDVEDLDEALKHWDVNAVDENGMTALHHASAGLKFDNVDRLLQEIPNGLDPQIEDRFGRDAAWIASEVNHHNAQSEKMYEKLSPHVYPTAEEDLELHNDALGDEGLDL